MAIDTKDADRVSGAERRRQLVEIAYRHIADKGFEGLRVRDVAAEAGINNATLHYYFPTKESLIQSVVGYLAQEFMVIRSPHPDMPAHNALEALQMELTDAQLRLQDTPEIGIVFTELKTRSLHDPHIATLLEQLDAGWHAHLVNLVERGIREGTFRSDLNPQSTARLIMAQIRGIGLQTMGQADHTQLGELTSQLAAQLALWLGNSP